MRYLNRLMLVFALVLFAAISRVNAEVVNDTDSPQDVRLYLQSTENITPDEKTDASEDEKRIWDVTFSTNELVWNVNQNVDGGAYYYVWNAETGKYHKYGIAFIINYVPYHIIFLMYVVLFLHKGKNLYLVITLQLRIFEFRCFFERNLRDVHHKTMK